MRTFKGVVVSDKMDKTVIVKVSRVSRHPVYQKNVIHLKKYAAHDEQNVCKIGETVVIRESRPLSKRKKWVVVLSDAQNQGEGV
jgi:small subunit ribosomal protein S17